MLTLTYRPGVDWEARHVSLCLRHVRQWLARRGHRIGYVWVAELQKRGAVHFHVMLWLPKGLTVPKPDKQGWWPHGMTNIAWARSSVGYLTKYATKWNGLGDVMPKGLRLHGRGGLEEARRVTVGWWLLPRYVREKVGEISRVIRAKGGGWVVTETGDWIEPWRRPFEPCGV